MVHGLNCCIRDPMSCIRHNTLNERTNSLILILNHRPHSHDHLNEDTFVRSVHIAIIETWCIDQSHITYGPYLHTRGYRLERLFAFEFAWFFNSIIIDIRHKLCYIIQERRFALSTFSKDTGFPFLRNLSMLSNFFILHCIFFIIHYSFPLQRFFKTMNSLLKPKKHL